MRKHPVKMRLEPSDEFMHPVEEEQSFNESMYFNFYDPGCRVGGFVRLGNRPNEGYAEMTTCLYLPDGCVAFMFARPEIHSNESFNAGGMRVAVVEPFQELRASYDGPVVVLEDPLEMSDPRQAFRSNPRRNCRLELSFAGVSPMYGGEPVGDDNRPLLEAEGEAPFARGHYEQHVSARGTLALGEQTWQLSAFGLRDHSWGPRYWQSPWFYRWLTANFDGDFGFVVSVITSRDGRKRIGGMVLRDGVYDKIRGARIETDWQPGELVHRGIRVIATTESDVTYCIDGRVLSLIPLRNRRKDDAGRDLTTRISEGLTEWQCEGRTGYGLSEYLDQIVDGRPVGTR